MKEIREENLSDENPKWLMIFLPFVSTILGGGALWYVWSRYNMLVNQPDSHWYGWVQVVFILLMGILCIWATTLLILGRPSGSSVLKLGISIVPLLLFSNLIILVFRVIQNIVQGNVTLFFDRVFAQPHKFILIPIVIITLILLDSLTKRDKSNS